MATLAEEDKARESLVRFAPSSFNPLFDSEAKQLFLPCEYYRVGKSYRCDQVSESFRSPFSNKYNPPTEEGRYPTHSMRLMETFMNERLKGYIKNYYKEGIGTSYAFEEEAKQLFTVVVLISKRTRP